MLIKTMTDVHKCCFETLTTFDSFCKSHNIEYYIAYGTLLGAVRNEDFIPWDDDVDIILKRDQYRKLLSIPASEYPEGFVLDLPCQNGIFFDFVTHFINLHYEGIRIDAESYYNESDSKFNPGLDIFILDECSSNFKHKFQIFRLRVYYLLARGHRQFKKSYSKNGKHYYLLNMLANILGFIGKHIRLDKICHKYDAISSKNTGSTEYFLSNLPIPLLTNIYSKTIYNDSVLLKIHGHLFPAPADFKTLLSIEYGDYLTLPKEEDRVSVHYKLESVDESDFA